MVDVIASTASNTAQCREKVDDMVTLYDRAKLLLEYTAQYADEIATALETHTVRSNKIGAGSSCHHRLERSESTLCSPRETRGFTGSRIQSPAASSGGRDGGGGGDRRGHEHCERENRIEWGWG